MKKIKAIIFDAGGVIIDQDGQLDELVKIFKPEDKKAFWRKLQHFVGPVCVGEISEKEYWQRIAKSENVDPKTVPPNLWLKKYEETTKMKQNIVNLIKKLRKNYRIILISNTMNVKY